MAARQRLRLGLALCAGVALAPLAFGAAAPAALAVANPGFEEETQGWARREAPADPQAIAVDREVRHSGAAAVRISQRDPQSYSSVNQVVPCQPDTDYVATAFLRAEGVERRGIGINLFIGDRQGLSVGRAIPLGLRAGTYDWTRVAVRFNSGSRDALSVHAYLHEAAGTVWFDDIAVSEAPAWPGPPRGPPRPPSPVLEGADVYDYESLRLDVPTPGWAFGGGTAGEGLAVTVLAPVMSQRESVELAQRYGCVVTPAMTWKPDLLGAPGFAYGAIGEGEALRRAREALGRPAAAILIGRQHWASLGAELQALVLERVRAGTGLVYVQDTGTDVVRELGLQEALPVDPQDFCGLPLAATPLGETTPGTAPASLVRGYRLGQGRVLVVDYASPLVPEHHCLCPPTQPWRGGFRHYDLYQSFLAKAVRWCGAQPRPVRLLAVEGPGRVRRRAPASVECRVEGADGKTVQVSALVWRLGVPLADGDPIEAALPVAAGRFSLAVPTELARGDYYVHLRLGLDGRTVDWGTTTLGIDEDVAIAGIDLGAEPVSSPTEPAEAVVRVTGEVPQSQRLRLQVLDAGDRVVAEETLAPVAAENRVRLEVSGSRSVGNRLRVWLELFRSVPIDVLERPFCVNQPFDPRDLHLLVWGHGGGTYTADLLRRQLRADGAELADVSTGPWTPDPLDEAVRGRVVATLSEVVSSGLRPVPYICRIWSDTATGDGSVRQPCLTDPAYRTSLTSALRERAALCRLYCPAGYTLGDENYLGQGHEFCRSETCLEALRDGLARRYRTVEALNHGWGTQYRTFADVMPPRGREVVLPAGLPPWVTWRQSMNRVFTDIHGQAAEAIRAEDPGARVGFDGALFEPVLMGYDWSQLGRRLDLLNVYLDQYDQVEALRSFASPEALTGCWFGGYTSHRHRPAYLRHAPAAQLFHGFNAVWFYSPFTCVGGSGETGFRHDLVPYPCWSLAAAETRRLSFGLAKLLLTAARDSFGIGLLYSPAAELVSRHDLRFGSHLEAFTAMGHWLEDCQVQFQVIDEATVADAEALHRDYAAVLLPTALALPDSAATALDAFVRQGGAVLADHGTGLYTDEGVRRATPLLDGLFGIAREADAGPTALEEGVPGYLPWTAVGAGTRGVQAAPLLRVGEVPVFLDHALGGGHAFYLNCALDGYEQVRGPAGGKLQMLLLSLLGDAGAGARVPLDGQWGTPERVEVFRWQRGNQSFVGLLKHWSTPAGGEDLTLDLPRDRVVYDLAAGGLVQERPLKLHLEAGQWGLYGVLPAAIGPVRMAPLGKDARGRPRFRIRSDNASTVAGGHVWGIRVIDAAGRPYLAAWENRVTEGPTFDHTVPVDLAAPHGEWRLQVVHAATGLQADCTFAVTGPLR